MEAPLTPLHGGDHRLMAGQRQLRRLVLSHSTHWLLLLALVMLLGRAMVGPLFAQSAWNNVTFTAGEVRDPGRNFRVRCSWMRTGGWSLSARKSRLRRYVATRRDSECATGSRRNRVDAGRTRSTRHHHHGGGNNDFNLWV